jgi:polyisoprenoid-binding protein YceI
MMAGDWRTRSTTALLLLMVGLAVTAMPVRAEGTWQMEEDASALRFIGRQQSAPFTGRFEQFTADIAFDPANPAAGSITATVDVRSAKTGNRDRDEYLQARDFFYSRKHPQANFSAASIRRQTGDADYDYVADGELTLRGETKPVTLYFDFETGEDEARMRGEVMLNRLDFGVGQGEWQDTGEIAAEVKVELDLALSAGAEPS